DGRQAAHAVLFRAARDCVLMHVVDLNIVAGACDLPHHFDGLLAGRAAGAENLNLVFHVRCSPSEVLSLKPAPTAMQEGQAGVKTARRGQTVPDCSRRFKTAAISPVLTPSGAPVLTPAHTGALAAVQEQAVERAVSIQAGVPLSACRTFPRRQHGQ